MRKLNQSGFIGLFEVGAIVLLIAVVGFTAYRINSINSEVDRSLNNTADGSESAQKQPITVKQEDEAKEVTIPKKEEPKDPAPVATETVKKTEPKATDVTKVKFTKGGGEQQGEAVKVSGTMESAQTGTCHFKFKKDGQDKVYVTKQINDSRTCSTEVAVSKFGSSGSWDFHLWFVSSDKSVQAYQDIYPIDITK